MDSIQLFYFCDELLKEAEQGLVPKVQGLPSPRFHPPRITMGTKGQVPKNPFSGNKVNPQTMTPKAAAATLRDIQESNDPQRRDLDLARKARTGAAMLAGGLVAGKAVGAAPSLLAEGVASGNALYHAGRLGGIKRVGEYARTLAPAYGSYLASHLAAPIIAGGGMEIGRRLSMRAAKKEKIADATTIRDLAYTAGGAGLLTGGLLLGHRAVKEYRNPSVQEDEALQAHLDAAKVHGLRHIARVARGLSNKPVSGPGPRQLTGPAGSSGPPQLTGPVGPGPNAPVPQGPGLRTIRATPSTLYRGMSARRF